MCIPFQCSSCQSYNIRNRPLVAGDVDSEVFDCLVIRATLDAFWSRSTRTIAGHLREVKLIIKYAGELGATNPLPRLGPFPLYHHLGMLQAIMVVRRSMEPGVKNDTVQYSTARQARAAYTLLWEASPEAGSDITLSSGSLKGRYVATCAPSEGRWYQHFNTGICARMGDVVRQDRAYTIEVLLKLVSMYELEWNDLGLAMPMHSLCSCMFLLLSCLGGMRGYEAVWTDLSALNYDLSWCEDREDYSAVSWPIVGRFKSEHGIAGCYMIPIAGTTDHGIEFFRWAQRFVARLTLEGREEGWAFQRTDGSRAKASDYKDNVFSKLETIQETTTLIDPLCDVWNDFGIQRSGRRFLNSHATNKGVDPHWIELQMRWSTDRANGVRTVQRSMIHVYSEVRNMKESLIKPSQVC